jgi:hypothetical protein
MGGIREMAELQGRTHSGDRSMVFVWLLGAEAAFLVP